ncbi:succinate dehydrogenase/fumarate reductase flavoprotein subunit [Spirochaetia bacterium]|nr:succinate dehydrogenase/fumarate reductase flavoprotein subunit [Spirochaetia bacterium]
MKKLLAIALTLAGICFACTGTPGGAQSRSFSATEQGFGGEVAVTLTIKGNKLVDVTIEGPGETPNVGQLAFAPLADRMIKGNSVEVDGVTGATFTSTAVIRAAKSALAASGVTLAAVRGGGTGGELRTFTTDVVVVGGGLAGLTAAISAADNGAKVIVLEKLPTTGGNAQSSLGSFMVAQVPENREYHVAAEPDTLDAAVARWKSYQDDFSYDKSSPYPDYGRLRYMLTQTMLTLKWLTTHGATFEAKSPIAERGMAMLQGNAPAETVTSTPSAANLLAHLRKVVEHEQGSTILLETPATDLIMDGNKVIGVRATSPEGPVEVYAKSVILACGSYTQNPDMVRELMPDIGELHPQAVISDTGDGIKMAQRQGAVLWGHDFIHPVPPTPSKEFLSVVPQATSIGIANHILMDKNGNRFLNEGVVSNLYAKIELRMAELKAGPYWQLISPANENETTVSRLETGLASGGVLKADTLDELAAKAGIAPAALRATVTRYNQSAASGTDAEFGKARANLIAYPATGPFYLMRTILSACDVLGGIKTDQDYKVLKADNSWIQNLWAAGSVSNKQYYNQYYFSGSSLSFATVSGKLTGAQAAANALN